LAKAINLISNTLGEALNNCKVEIQKERIRKYWNKYQDKTDNIILKSLWSAYKYEFLLAIFWQFIRGNLQIVISL